MNFTPPLVMVQRLVRCARLCADSAKDAFPHSVWSGARVLSLLVPNAAVARKIAPTTGPPASVVCPAALSQCASRRTMGV